MAYTLADHNKKTTISKEYYKKIIDLRSDIAKEQKKRSNEGPSYRI
jgi:hypothetical protein